MAFLNNHAARFRRGLPSANPFSAARETWCPRCQQVVDTTERMAHRHTTFAYKRWCCRCGDVVTRGVSDNVVVLTGVLSPEAQAWSREGGEDRS